jgi:cullin 3
MYRLFKLATTALTCILDKLQDYIETKGKQIVADPELVKNPIAFTRKLLEFKSQMDEIVERAFLNDVRFQKCRDNAF